MDKIAETKNEMRLKVWTVVYAKYQESGMAVTTWCERCGLPVKTFYYRLRKTHEAALEKQEQHQIAPISTQTINMPASEPSGVKINGSGIMIELPESISAEAITTVLKELR